MAAPGHVVDYGIDIELQEERMSQSTHTATMEDVRKFNDACQALRSEVAKTIVGQDLVVEELLIALFAGGHCLLVGVPGLAKTLLISTVAQALDLKFSRIQFTPDLMPSDITGTEILEEDAVTRKRSFRFIPGPIFGNVILDDEINRCRRRKSQRVGRRTRSICRSSF
jgi:MoxR-like ATPase